MAFARLNDEFGFVLDVCSSTVNHKVDNFYALDHPDAARRDGLARDWATDAAAAAEDRVVSGWCNPPYGRGIEHWMRKAFETAQAGVTMVCLVPARTSTRWWHDLVLSTGAEVRYVKGRLTFGDAQNSAPFASAVVIYRPSDGVGVPGLVGVMDAKARPPKGAVAA